MQWIAPLILRVLALTNGIAAVNSGGAAVSKRCSWVALGIVQAALCDEPLHHRGLFSSLNRHYRRLRAAARLVSEDIQMVGIRCAEICLKTPVRCSGTVPGRSQPTEWESERNKREWVDLALRSMWWISPQQL